MTRFAPLGAMLRRWHWLTTPRRLTVEWKNIHIPGPRSSSVFAGLMTVYFWFVYVFFGAAIWLAWNVAGLRRTMHATKLSLPVCFVLGTLTALVLARLERTDEPGEGIARFRLRLVPQAIADPISTLREALDRRARGHFSGAPLFAGSALEIANRLYALFKLDAEFDGPLNRCVIVQYLVREIRALRAVCIELSLENVAHYLTPSELHELSYDVSRALGVDIRSYVTELSDEMAELLSDLSKRLIEPPAALGGS